MGRGPHSRPPEDVALTPNKVGATESFEQERDMTWLPF